MPERWRNIIVRLNGSDPQCASTDGKQCLRNPGFSTDCLPWQGRKLDTITLKPLQCGAQHAKVWPGSTGYSEGGHWCNPAKKKLLEAASK